MNIDTTHSRGPADSTWAWGRNETACISALLLFALLLRYAFFTGFFGSDDVVYVQMAYGIAQGQWEQSDYIGALRYGVNIPVAFFMMLFGASETAAALWGVITSLGEVALVFAFAQQLWGLRAAVLATLCLAVLPIHVSFATRFTADAPLAFFLTAVLVCTWMAEKRGSAVYYFLAGLAAGGVFWVKDVVFYIALFVMGVYIVVYRRWHSRWLMSAAAALVIILINCLLFWRVHGDPWYLFTRFFPAMQGGNPLNLLDRWFAGGQAAEPLGPQTSAGYYVNYLLLDIRHTWLLFYMTLGGVCLMWIWRRRQQFNAFHWPDGLLLVWGFGFLAVLSGLVLRQPNYILIFAAPFALLAGYFLASLPRNILWPSIALFAGGSVILAAFQQQAIQAFTANSRASNAFAATHPQALVFAGQGARRAQIYEGMVGDGSRNGPPMVSWSRIGKVLNGQIDTAVFPHAKGASEAFLIMDPQMAQWGDQPDSQWKKQFESTCLVRHSTLPTGTQGLGRHITDAVIAAVGLLPTGLRDKIQAMLHRTLKVQTATVFKIVEPCFKPEATIPK